MLEVIEHENVTLKGKLNEIEKNDKPSKTPLREELKLVEELTVNIECNICGQTFESRSLLKMHIRKKLLVWKPKLFLVHVSGLKSCLFSMYV